MNGQDAYNNLLVPYSIMPMNSSLDFVAREVDIAQPVMASGPGAANQGGDFIAYRHSGNAGAWATGDRTDALTSANDGAGQHLIAFAQNQRDEIRMMDVAGACSAQAGMKQTTYVRTPRIRKMTPREWERLQGYPDDFTLVPHRGKPMADGPRYKMLGNSMAVPCISWIGERIQTVEAITARKAAA